MKEKVIDYVFRGAVSQFPSLCRVHVAAVELAPTGKFLRAVGRVLIRVGLIHGQLLPEPRMDCGTPSREKRPH